MTKMVTSATKTPRAKRDCKVVMMDLLWISLQFVFRGAAPTPRESVVISPRHARRRLEFSRGFQPTAKFPPPLRGEETRDVVARRNLDNYKLFRSGARYLQPHMFLSRAVGRQNGEGGFHRLFAAATYRAT